MISSDVTVARPAVPGAQPGVTLPAGPPGASAYQIAVAEGFVGSPAQWLASIQGVDADPTLLNAATAEASAAAISAIQSATTARGAAGDAAASAGAAASSATAAGTAAAFAGTRASAADASATAAATSAATAASWACSMAGTVDGTNYSARYYAEQAHASAQQAAVGRVTPSGSFTVGHVLVAGDTAGAQASDGGPLGSLAQQSASNIAVTGGTIDGVTIGAATPAAGQFTTVSAATPIAVTSGGTGSKTAGGGALDNVLGIAGASGGGLLTRTAAGSYSFTGSASFAAAAITVTGSGALSGGGDLTANRTLDIATNGVTNAKLAQMPTLTLKGNLTGAAANAADVTPSAVLDAAFGATQGMLLYRGGSGWAALGVGTSGYVLTAGGAAANPSWVAPAGASGAPTATIATTSGTNLTAAAADKGKVYNLVGSAVLSLPAAVQTSGWYAFVKKVDGTGVWAITPSGVTIDGLSSINMYSEGSYLIWWDATNGVFRTQGRPKGWITVGTTTIASTVSTLALSAGFNDTELRDMRFVLDGMVSPSTTSDKLAFRVQKNGAYATTAYANVTTTNNSSAVSSTYAGAYHLISSAFASYGVFGEIDLPLFASTSALGQRLSAKAFSETLVSDRTDGTHSPGTPGAITAIQIYCVGGQSLSGGVVSQRGLRQ